MLRINYYVLALVLWISFLFSVERLGQDEILNIASPIYVVAVLVVVLGLVLPHLKRTSVWTMYFIAGALFLIAKLGDPRPDWGGGYTYLTLFELGSVVITAALSYAVGRYVTDFVDTVQALLLSDLPSPVYSFEEAEAVLKRELQYSRRANQPLSLMVIEPTPESRVAALHSTAQEIQKLLVERYSLVALIRLLARRVRRTDLVVYRQEAGRLIMLALTTKKDQAEAVVKRLEQQAAEHLGIHLAWSTATFPDDGVTVEELIHRAEQGLHPDQSRPETPLVERREVVAELHSNGHEEIKPAEPYTGEMIESLKRA